MDSKTYYIYHIPGVKIGCTYNIKQRIMNYKHPNYEILETHIDIFIASDREQELQKQYGYKVDTVPYWKVIKTYKPNVKTRSNNGKLASSKYSKTNGFNAVLTGQWDSIKHLGSLIQQKSILVYNKETNMFISEYDSLTSAASALKCSISKICQVAKGQRKSHKGYTFKYKLD
jgi:hypothetical protein